MCPGKSYFVVVGVTDDVIGQAKVKMFDDLSCLVSLNTVAVSNGKSQEMNMVRVWDIYKQNS